MWNFGFKFEIPELGLFIEIIRYDCQAAKKFIRVRLNTQNKVELSSQKNNGLIEFAANSNCY